MNTLGFYPGCSLKGGAREYNESVVAIAKQFDIELKEISDWNCCGATAAHNMNKELSLALPARILANAEKDGFSEIVVPCAACYSRLVVTEHELAESDELRKKVSEIIESDYKGNVTVINIVQFIEKYILDKVQYKLQKYFNYKVACYYGCLLVRPYKILNFDRPEDPQSMDKVMKEIGATPIEWAFKTECCGAGLSVSRTDLIGKLSGKIVEDAIDRGAEAIIVACPMCHSNLDMRRPEIEKYMNRKSSIPVIFITQAIGMVMGLSDKELGLSRHMVKVNLPLDTDEPLVKKVVEQLQEEEE
jgi:heterodisulfide reductase subunit B2